MSATLIYIALCKSSCPPAHEPPRLECHNILPQRLLEELAIFDHPKARFKGALRAQGSGSSLPALPMNLQDWNVIISCRKGSWKNWLFLTTPRQGSRAHCAIKVRGALSPRR